MKFATIVSGSSGNCVYIEGGSTRVLIDAGLTLKTLKAACAQYGCAPTDFAALLITHEHNDHISGAERIWRRFGVPLWASVSTWENLPFSACFSEKERHMFEYGMSIGELKFDFFRLSHDSVQPVGIIVEHEGRRLAIATDTGCVTPSMAKALQDCDGYVLEANHDLDMLKKGPYSYALKRRVMSDQGHLSNAQAALALSHLVGPHTRHVILAHLSETNNTPELAMGQVMAVMQGSPYHPVITVAPRHVPHKLVEL